MADYDGTTGSPASPMSADQEREAARKVLRSMKETPLKSNERWYVLSMRWYRLWCRYARLNDPDNSAPSSSSPSSPPASPICTERPGPIDNTDILFGAQVSSTSTPSSSPALKPTPQLFLAARSATVCLPSLGSSLSLDEKQSYAMRLRDKLLCSYDYLVVSSAMWDLLHGWYGGGPALLRYSMPESVEEGSGKCTVEVYQVHLTVEVTDARGLVNLSSGEEFVMSRRTTVAELKRCCCDKWAVADVTTARLCCGKRVLCKANAVKEKATTVEQLGLAEGSRLRLEVKLASGEWPSASSEGSGRARKNSLKRFAGWFGRGLMNFLIGGPYTDQDYGTYGSDFEDDEEDDEGDGSAPAATHVPGLCGLVNLGNTCFMNSALQCLSNTPQLSEYFASGEFVSHVNTANRLGSKGQIAEQFGKLMQMIWSGGFTKISPRSFKRVLGKWAPQFSGYSQHDSQELVAFLLDGLHEDLNEITKKQFVEMPEGGDGRPDAEIARLAWECHLRRNRSLIVDTFQGQLKSTLICPDCSKVSVTFDPFMFLSVPLPVSRERTFEVIVFPWPASDEYPIRYGLRAPKQSKAELLAAGVSALYSKQCGRQVPAEELQLATVYCNKIYSYLTSEVSVSSIQPSDIVVAYHVPAEVSKSPDRLRVQIMHRKRVVMSGADPAGPGASTAYARCPWLLMGLPLTLFLRKACTGSELYQEVWTWVKKAIPGFSIGGGGAKEPRLLKPPKHHRHHKHRSKGSQEAKESSCIGDVDSPSPSADSSRAPSENPSPAATPVSGPAVAPAESPRQTERESPRATNGHEHARDPETGAEYPFVLSYVTSSGLSCVKCPYSVDCFGCHVECTSAPVDFATCTRYSTTMTLSTDWCPQCLVDRPKVEDGTALVQVHQSCKEIRESANRTVSLDDCMRLFITNEQLGPDDCVYCSQCKGHKQAFKKFDLWRLPKVLVLHLKRFQFTRMFREKIGMEVAFPLEGWDLSRLLPASSSVPAAPAPSAPSDPSGDIVVAPPQPPPVAPVYDLISVSNHVGGLGGGHYTAYAKNRTTSKWYLFNDSSVAEVSPNSVQSGAAYVLFYRLRDEPTSVVPPEAPHT